ncbi:MAG TPA: hypothetical protein VFA84_09520 [Acidimicrobiales bacterium]|nr:hypothetical protein [Acidimicrobiales bacterium]
MKEGEGGQVEGRGVEAVLAEHLRQVEHLLSAQRLTHAGLDIVVPAWRRVTEGEPRWPASIAIAVAIGLQTALPNHLALAPRWLLPSVEALILVSLLSANPKRINRTSPAIRGAAIVLIVVASLANAWSAGSLVTGIVNGTEGRDPTTLLLTGAAIWVTNVIVFALWYWELDRSGPAARAHAMVVNPDFLFPQMTTPDLTPPEWEPEFVDYLYLSFTNATAFSPTDVLPMSRWSKLTMMLQSCVSLATVALVVARAVNILR